MNEAYFDVYYRRASQLADAMKLCQLDLSGYSSAAALLAVHSAISYNDALLIGFGGKRSKGENHRDAITALKRACTLKKIKDKQGIGHFQKLISAKSEIAYGDKRLADKEVEKLCTTAERFQVWSEKTLKTLKS